MSKLARNHRNTDLGTIHVLKKQLLEAGNFQNDDDYRAMLWAQARQQSAKDLDHAARLKVIAHMRALLGIQQKVNRVRAPLTARQRLIWSLWQQLADAKAITDRRMGGLMTYVTRQTGVQRLEWLTTAQEELVAESLKNWLDRLKSGGGKGSING